MPAPHDKPPPLPADVAPPRRPTPRFRDTALASGLLTAAQIEACEDEAGRTIDSAARADAARWDAAIAECLVKQSILTRFQADQLLAGRRKLTLGQYHILDEIGRGGMGQVFRAQHVLMGRTVAIKVLPRAKSTPETEAAFQREIRMLARLDHGNLVRALDAGHDGKVYYLVTELVPGLDLRRQVLRHGRLGDAAAASVISQAAQGLAYAHAQGLSHRDVKPANILVTPEGRVKVLDLGLAGSVREGEVQKLGRVVGTMDYMAPEQIRSPDTAGPSADVYGLGCTLYFTLTGELPFPGGTRQEKAKRQLAEEPRPIRQLVPEAGQGICRVVEEMMRKDPRKRLPSAEAVIERLRQWAPETPVPMPRTKPSRASSSARPAHAANASAGQQPAGESSLSHVSGMSAPSRSQPTWGLWSAADDTQRDASLTPLVQPATVHAGSGAGTDATSAALERIRAGAWVLGRSVLVAAVAAVLLALSMWMVGFNGMTLARLLGERGVGLAGWAAFLLILGWQLASALRGAGRRL